MRGAFVLMLLPHSGAANLDNAAAANADNRRNLEGLVAAIRSLQSGGGTSGNLAAVVAHLQTLTDAGTANRGLAALLPEVSRQQILRDRRHQRAGLPPPSARRLTSRPNSTARNRQQTLAWSNLVWLTTGTGTAANPAAPPPKLDADVWLQGWYDDAVQDNRQGLEGFDAYGTGYSGGIDFNLSDNLALGLEAGRYRADVDSDLFGEDETTSNSWGASLYYSTDHEWFGQPVYQSWRLHYSHSRSSIDRRRLMLVLLDDTLRGIQLTSDIDAETDSSGINWALSFNAGDFVLQPYLAIEYSNLSTDDYLENGGGSLNLFVSSADEEQLVGTLGAALSRQYFAGNWMIAPSISAAFEHDFRADPTVTLSRFRGTDASFSTRGYAIEENRWRYSVSIGFYHTADWGISVSYQAQQKDDYRYQGAALSLQAKL